MDCAQRDAMPATIDARLLRVLIQLAEDKTATAQERLDAARQLIELKRGRSQRTGSKTTKRDSLLGTG